MKRIAVILLLSPLLLTSCAMGPDAPLEEATFERLEKVREEKQEAILARLHRLQAKTDAAQNDDRLKRAYAQLEGLTGPALTTLSTQQTMEGLARHFVTNYSAFYDLLFIKRDGTVFHTLRREEDYGINLFQGRLADSRLARALKQSPVPKFVDYDYYRPSDEAASFFIHPMGERGWIAFQFPMNAFNAILADYRDLGTTGEAYLTNAQKVMLTQSRLIPQPTTLSTRVETPAPKLGLERGRGNMLLDDYRRVRVFSSFSRIDFQNVAWVLIVEIDEEEVLSRHFRENSDFYLEKILPLTGAGKPGALPPNGLAGERLKVDINEFARGEPGQRLFTQGVAACTAVVIADPDRFAYLGHISPLDDAYLSGFSGLAARLGLWLRQEETPRGDLLGMMLDRISRFDLPHAALRNLRVVLAAVHQKSFGEIVNRLLDRGIFLSQIQILYAPGMTYGNVAATASGVEVRVEWVNDAAGRDIRTRAAHTPNLLDLARRTAGLET